MSALRNHINPLCPLLCFCSPFPKHLNLQNPSLFSSHAKFLLFSEVSQKFRVLKSSFTRADGNCAFHCSCKQNSDIEQKSTEEHLERPPFDINLAVVLAGFAFEAYSSPPENIGRREVDAADCQTVFISESFLREVYDGQLFIKLKKGVGFPAMDPWGTSDPYVVMQLDGQVVKSMVKWATKEPKWNEDFTLNIKLPPTKNLQVAAWDANLVTPHKRMGNAAINLESLCDGTLHEVLMELEGLGGGGRIHLEVKYKSFDEIYEEKKWWWKIPYISDLLAKNSFESALKMVLGSDSIKAQQFVRYALGQLRSFDHASQKDQFSEGGSSDMGVSGKFINPVGDSDTPLHQESCSDGSEKSINLFGVSDMPIQQEINMKGSLDDLNCQEDSKFLKYHTKNDSGGDTSNSLPETRADESIQSDNLFWKNFAGVLNQTVVQKLGFPIPEKIRWDGFDMLNRIGLQSKQIAEAWYIESGLAAPESQGVDDGDQTSAIQSIPPSLPDIKKLSWDVLRQTDSILGALMLLSTTFAQQNKEAYSLGNSETENDASTAVVNGVLGYSTSESVVTTLDGSSLDERKAEEMKALFSTAESAMEAWAMLATSLGHPSFIKSEFEKICFLDNSSTDTQVAIWRDSPRKRLVVAFRGTEQARWKDLRTDLMLVPAGLNPERVGGDFKQEVQVHSGFLSAYDSVRIRLMSLIKLSIGFVDDDSEGMLKWHIYVTGHSLGGALATLLALELSSSQMTKRGAISLTMYNFGSPRVGNRRFVEVYNEKVKDSWRVVNHRDIIPSVPRLMGYCHVAQPVYLATGDLNEALENMELLADGYQGDVLGESTPDVLVSEFMKGEKELIERILLTEINLFRSIRDGSALMQHMEDFYYVTLLENVRSNYQTVGILNSNEEGSVSIS